MLHHLRDSAGYAYVPSKLLGALTEMGDSLELRCRKSRLAIACLGSAKVRPAHRLESTSVLLSVEPGR